MLFDVSVLNWSIWGCIIPLATFVLFYGAILKSAQPTSCEGGLPIGWFSLLGLKTIYFGLTIATLIDATTHSFVLASFGFLAFQIYALRHSKPKEGIAEFIKQFPYVIIFLLFCLLISAHLLRFGGPVSSDDGTAHYSIIRKLYNSHHYFLGATHMMHDIAGDKKHFYFYPFLNHTLVARLYNFYQIFGADLDTLIPAEIICFAGLGIIGFAAFIPAYKDAFPSVSILTLLVLSCALPAVWQLAYHYGGEFRIISCLVTFLVALTLLRDAQRNSPTYKWELPLFIITTFLLHTQAFIVGGLVIAYIFVTIPEQRKHTAIAGIICGLLIYFLLKAHSTVLSNVARDSFRIYNVVTKNEIADGELRSLLIYMFMNGADLKNSLLNANFGAIGYICGSGFLALILWHKTRGKPFDFPLTPILVIAFSLTVFFSVTLSVMPEEFVPNFLTPFAAANLRIADLIAPFVLLGLTILLLKNAPPAPLVILLGCGIFLASAQLALDEEAAASFHTLSSNEHHNAKQVLPEGKVLIIAGDRKYEVLGGLHPGYVSETSYFDCPMPGDYQFPPCHRALNHGFALRDCKFNDSLREEIRDDYPGYTAFFIISSPWGQGESCKNMKDRYLEETLNSTDMLIYKIK